MIQIEHRLSEWSSSNLVVLGYFNLENSVVPKVLTFMQSTSSSGLEIKGNITLRWIPSSLIVDYLTSCFPITRSRTSSLWLKFRKLLSVLDHISSEQLEGNHESTENGNWTRKKSFQQHWFSSAFLWKQKLGKVSVLEYWWRSSDYKR